MTDHDDVNDNNSPFYMRLLHELVNLLLSHCSVRSHEKVGRESRFDFHVLQLSMAPLIVPPILLIALEHAFFELFKGKVEAFSPITILHHQTTIIPIDEPLVFNTEYAVSFLVHVAHMVHVSQLTL